MQNRLAVFSVAMFIAAFPASAAYHAVSEQKNDASNVRAEARQERLDNREATTQGQSDRNDISQRAAGQAKEDFRTSREKNRAELKEKLATIRDERKKAAVERIAENLNIANDKAVARFTEVVSKLDAIIAKLETRLAAESAQGKNVTAVTTALTTSKQAVDALRQAVVLQAGKSYFVTITTEGTLGTAVSTARQALHTDLRTIKSLLRESRSALDAVARAFRLLNTSSTE